ncbi:MAG TPA: hypothetical protein VNN73_08340 [Blastocatellia bacterium]|nr:hypothetical protein [Blastocatellia bacterium]
MQKRLRACAAAALASVVLATSVVSAALQSAASISKTDAAAALSATDEILKVVSRLRGLEIKQAVKSGLKTKDEIEQAVIRDLDESTSPEEFDAMQKTFAKLGLTKKDFRLREYMVALMREQVAGFYEPKTGEFYLAAWLPISDQKRVIAHELVHALQDQHFDLRRFEKWPKGDSDAELAAHALVEGEATLVMIQYDLDQQGIRLDLTKLPSLANTMLDQDTDSDAKNYPVLASAPKVLRENLQFPYIYGAGFVQSVLKSGSWQTLNNGYTNLPASSEQIIHPEKFLTRDNPVKIEMADLLPALGKSWKQADADVNGEFGYQVLLAEFIPKQSARTAAAGWGGDRYALYENKETSALIVAQYTTWDTANDAREFFDAYANRTEKRYGAARAKDSTAQLRVYETGEGLVSIEMRGSDVVIIEGAQDREQLQRLSAQLWQSKKK